MGRWQTVVPEEYTTVYRSYAAALRATTGLSEHTRRAYDARVRAFLTWAAHTGLSLDLLHDPGHRDQAVRAYLHHLHAQGRTPRTADAHLTALDHLFTHLHLDPPQISRNNPPPTTTRALDERQQAAYLTAVRQRPLARDRAIGHLLLHAGLHISELAALDVTDLTIGPRSGSITVPPDRRIRLTDAPTRRALHAWLTDRDTWPGAHTPALFLNRRGGRLTTRAIAGLVTQLAITAGLTGPDGHPATTARTLRHTANHGPPR